VESSSLETTIFAPSIVYDHTDPWITLLRRFSFLPVLPVSGEGEARFQPIWAQDAARCVVAALRRDGERRYELAGPETLSYDEMSIWCPRRRRPARSSLPLPLVRSGDRDPLPFQRGRVPAWESGADGGSDDQRTRLGRCEALE
jgi:NADH dehydrogenase